ncbi:hypothetical protein [Promicromonospora sp. NPDC019610]|uniref:hypothetical protein n=1 Tax=Promicromonospora sp. NPDC019610 TaxID=3364405 RepID=UPI0037A1CBED
MRRDRRLGSWIVGGLVGAVLMAAVVGMLGLRGADDLDPVFAPTDVPTALPVGGAAQGAGATEYVAGVPAGFPQSIDGAVSALMTYSNAADAALSRTPQERAEIAERIFTDQGRAASGLSDQAAADVQDRPDATAFTGCAYEFGAYKVVSVGSHSVESPDPDEPAQVPTEVVVSTWARCLSGVGGARDTSDVDIRWTHHAATLRWDGRDWRVDTVVSPGGRVPEPDDPDDIAITLEERARLLGTGWTLPADATEEVATDFWSRGSL